jgi:catechol 2,3-dioxygenase-like lactoylglutathione lyase family enzyme
MNALSRWTIISLLAVATVAHAQATDTTPRLTGIAHVAIRVNDLAKSRAFYKTLGFTEPFNITDKDGNVTEQFVKINDRQYLELYPSDATHPAGFLHVCWEAVNLEGLYPILTAHGVVSPPVRKAGAGNMLMAWKGPEEQTVEITEYMPGSRHSNDFGRDLGPDRISDTLTAAIVAVLDAKTLVDYFHNQMGFRTEENKMGVTFAEPQAAHDNFIGISPNGPVPFAILVFHVASISAAKAAIESRGLQIGKHFKLALMDPDNNIIVFDTEPPTKLDVEGTGKSE